MTPVWAHGAWYFTNIQSPFNTRLHVKFEEIWVSEEKSFKGVNGRTDRRTTDDGRRVITIALWLRWAKKLNKRNLLKICLRVAYPTVLWIICIHFYYEKSENIWIFIKTND